MSISAARCFAEASSGALGCYIAWRVVQRVLRRGAFDMASHDDIDARESDDEDGGFDLDRLKQLAGFFRRAPRRRPKLAIATFVIGVAIVIGLAFVWPRTYTVDLRFLAQRNLVLPALGNPNRNVPRDADNPTKNVVDMIMRRDNLMALAKQVNLVDRWRATRSPAFRLKDRLSAAAFGAGTEEDQLKGLVLGLEQKLLITTDESSISISLDGPDPQLAFDLVSVLEKNFVDARYDSEVAVINEAIDILTERAKEQGVEVDQALADLLKLDQETRKQFAAAGAAPTTVAPPAPAPAPGNAPQLPRPIRAPAPVAANPDTSVEDVAQLENVRRQIRDLEARQKGRLADAQRQLEDARVTMGPMHPTVKALNQKIEQLSEPSPELSALRGEEREIVARLATNTRLAPLAGVAPSFVAPGPAGGGATRPAPTSAKSIAAAAQLLPSPQDDPQLALARAKLSTAASHYDELLRRIDSAKIELDVTRAAFKYRYVVVRGPELPKKPRKPNVPLLVIGGLVAVAFLSFLLAGLRDLVSGRLLERWQVEQKLKLPVLGELAVSRIVALTGNPQDRP